MLVCARLGALASDAAKEGTPEKQALAQYLSTYIGTHCPDSYLQGQ